MPFQDEENAPDDEAAAGPVPLQHPSMARDQIDHFCALSEESLLSEMEQGDEGSGLGFKSGEGGEKKRRLLCGALASYHPIAESSDELEW